MLKKNLIEEDGIYGLNIIPTYNYEWFWLVEAGLPEIRIHLKKEDNQITILNKKINGKSYAQKYNKDGSIGFMKWSYSKWRVRAITRALFKLFPNMKREDAPFPFGYLTRFTY